MSGNFFNNPDQDTKYEPIDHLRRIKPFGVNIKNGKEDQTGKQTKPEKSFKSILL